MRRVACKVIRCSFQKYGRPCIIFNPKYHHKADSSFDRLPYLYSPRFYYKIFQVFYFRNLLVYEPKRSSE